MKKFFTLLVPLLFVLTSCNANIIDAETNKESCNHKFDDWIITTEATCTDKGEKIRICSKCSVAKKQSIDALGHTTTTGICSRCQQSFGLWKTDFYVDEFNNATNAEYIRMKEDCYGTFSNSATTDSNLRARLLIDEHGVYIKLFEYGDLEVKASSYTEYTITVLDDSNQKHYLPNGYMNKNDDRIYMQGWNLVRLLLDNSQISIYITEDAEYGVNSTYLFSVTRDNFTQIYSEFYDKYFSEDRTDNDLTLEDGILQVGVSPDWKPYEYTDNGELKGIEVDILKAIATELGLEIRFENDSFEKLLPNLTSKTVDCIIGLTETDERNEIAIATDRMFSNADSEFIIYVNKDSTNLYNELNSAISTLTDDGTIAAIINSYKDLYL